MGFAKKMVPVFVLGKYSNFRLNKIDKSAGICGGVERQVVHKVCQRCVFPYFVSRWGKESNHDFLFGKCCPEIFQYRPSLLKFTKRGGGGPGAGRGAGGGRRGAPAEP